MSGLEQGRQNKSDRQTSDWYVNYIGRHGVNFQITADDERKIRKHGVYLGPRGLARLIKAIRSNYRPASTGLLSSSSVNPETPAPSITSLPETQTITTPPPLLVIHVSDINGEPIAGVVLSNKADGYLGEPTDSSGITHIKLPINTRPNDSVFVQLVQGIKGNQEWTLIGDGRVIVPPFDNKPERFVPLILMSRNDKQRLETNKFVNTPSGESQSNNERTSDGSRRENQPQTQLEEMMNILKRDGTDKLIEYINARENDFEESKYFMAQILLSKGQAFYGQGKYEESIIAYRAAQFLLPNNIIVLKRLGMALIKIENYTDADTIYRQLVPIMEITLGKEHIDIADALMNYAIVLHKTNKESEAQKVEENARRIRAKHAQPSH